MKNMLSISLAIGVTLFAASLHSQSDQSKLTEADRDFFQKAAQANVAEIEGGKLAQSKAARADIKQFGEKMEQDHSKTLQELQALAAKKGVSLPDGPDEAHQALAKQLAAASGKEFDRTYVTHAGVADHKAAKTLFEKGAKSQDADVRAFAKKVLPHIEHHLQMAQAIAAKG